MNDATHPASGGPGPKADAASLDAASLDAASLDADPRDTTLREIVRDLSDLTGVSPPAVLADDAPVPVAGVGHASFDVSAPYLVPLVGGKEVGKTSLANALVGRALSEPSSHGRGTRQAIVYAHADAVADAARTLDGVIGRTYTIHTHDDERSRRQVLVDAPDIDSRFEDHVALVRRLLRAALFPVWVQSVEKYADAKPLALLGAVAEGNDPANFVFVLSKIDLVASREGPDAVEAIRDDYAERLRQRLGLTEPPRVYAVTVTDDGAFDLPALRSLLRRDREVAEVERAVRLATRKRREGVLRWVDERRPDDLAAEASRLHEHAASRVRAELAEPVLRAIVGRVLSSPAWRSDLVEPIVSVRMRRWPIVNVIDALLAPLWLLARRAADRTASTSSTATRFSIDSALGEPPLAQRVGGVFAGLHRSHPAVVDLYADAPPWEDPPAAAAAARLRRAAERLLEPDAEASRRVCSPFTAPLRLGLTVGATLWFPFAQPALDLFLNDGFTTRGVTTLAVRLLSVHYLLTTLAFLSAYFLILWAFLRVWTTRRALRGVQDEPTVAALRDVVKAWSDGLLAPIAARQMRVTGIAHSVHALRLAQDESATPP